MSGRVAIVFGTRPEIVKLAGIVGGLGPTGWTIHTGQHWDDRMSGSFLRDLHIGRPDVVLGVGGLSRGAALGRMVEQLTELWAGERPSAVVVQGDTTTALAGGLAANAADIPLVHIEAGLRSFDRAMPEEHNRVLVDHLSDRCAAPTEVCRANLAAEGIGGERVSVTGNTVVDAVELLKPDEAHVAKALAELGVEKDGFVLSTFHRPENVDDGARLAAVLDQLVRLVTPDRPVVLAIHPRTADNAARAGLEDLLSRLRVVPPVDYRTFLALGSAAALLVSDSGGVQEEASVLKRPVLVVRRSTERPEVIGTFAELVAVDDVADRAGPWLADPAAQRRRLATIPSPYGDGRASQRCCELVRALIA